MKNIEKDLKERILVIDGAMGTMIQQYKLQEKDYRGDRFRDWLQDWRHLAGAPTRPMFPVAMCPFCNQRSYFD